jgi:type IV pilus assembly protein PilV
MKTSTIQGHQRGASLIEILVTVLILSVGLLAMGAMMSYAVQLPKASGNRSVAIAAGTNMIERMRSNPTTASPVFSIASYETTTFSATFPTSTALTSSCTYPNCTQANIAAMDIALVQQQLNLQLPPAGIAIQVTNAANNEGNLWVIWQEAATFGTFSTSASDNCNTATVALGLTPPPRCVYLPFKL